MFRKAQRKLFNLNQNSAKKKKHHTQFNASTALNRFYKKHNIYRALNEEDKTLDLEYLIMGADPNESIADNEISYSRYIHSQLCQAPLKSPLEKSAAAKLSLAKSAELDFEMEQARFIDIISNDLDELKCCFLDKYPENIAIAIYNSIEKINKSADLALIYQSKLEDNLDKLTNTSSTEVDKYLNIDLEQNLSKADLKLGLNERKLLANFISQSLIEKKVYKNDEAFPRLANFVKLLNGLSDQECKLSLKDILQSNFSQQEQSLFAIYKFLEMLRNLHESDSSLDTDMEIGKLIEKLNPQKNSKLLYKLFSIKQSKIKNIQEFKDLGLDIKLKEILVSKLFK